MTTLMFKNHEEGVIEKVEFLDGAFIHSRFNPKGRTESVTQTYEYVAKAKQLIIAEYLDLGFILADQLKRAV